MYFRLFNHVDTFHFFNVNSFFFNIFQKKLYLKMSGEGLDSLLATIGRPQQAKQPIFDIDNPPLFLGDNNSAVYIFATSVVGGVCLISTSIMLMRSCYFYSTKTNKLSYIFGTISMISSILFYILFIFGFTSLFNNIDFYHDYKQLISNNQKNKLQFVDLGDLASVVLFGISKSSFYASLSFGLFTKKYSFNKVLISVITICVIFWGLVIAESYLIVQHDTAHELFYSKKYNIFMINISPEAGIVRTVLGLVYTIVDVIYSIGSLIVCAVSIKSDQGIVTFFISSFMLVLVTVLTMLPIAADIVGLTMALYLLMCVVDDFGIFINYDENIALFYMLFCCFKSKKNSNEYPKYSTIEMESSGIDTASQSDIQSDA